MQFISYLKYKIQFWKDSLKFRFRVFLNDGFVGRPLYISGPDYVKVGKGLRLKSNFRIESYQFFHGKHYNPSFVIGNKVNIGFNFTCFIADLVEIGDETILAGSVTLVSENHGINPESETPYHAQDLTTGPIKIGKGCWIGQGVVVLPNVEIGDKVIIGSNSVVTKSIPSYTIAAGVPAKVIKKFNFESHTWERV
ncbi:MAG: acyltransferase [Paludibacteraceae bacterium]|nr:acyltransferase [Paludibacteraceae bacterium]